MAFLNRVSRVCGLVLLCMIAGCGSGRSPLGQVTGVVTCDGEPIEKASIVFHNPHGRSAVGQITDGVIENVTTYDRPNDGAAVGTLAVTIHPIADRPTRPPEKVLEQPKSKSPKRRPRPLLPERYSKPETSGLTADIQPGNNEVVFDLSH